MRLVLFLHTHTHAVVPYTVREQKQVVQDCKVKTDTNYCDRVIRGKNTLNNLAPLQDALRVRIHCPIFITIRS